MNEYVFSVTEKRTVNIGADTEREAVQTLLELIGEDDLIDYELIDVLTEDVDKKYDEKRLEEL